MPVAALRSASVCLRALGLGVTAAATAAAAMAGGAPAYDFSQVSGFVESERNRLGLEGAALLVGIDGSIVFEAYFGGYDPNTAVPIASASKWPSAAAVMTLVDAGLIDLDAPVSTWLPEFAGRKGRMSVRQMLSLTSGIRRDELPRTRRFVSLAEFSADFAVHGRLVAEPGNDFRYSGSSFQLAGRVAEVASGLDFRALFRARLARPCGMQHFRYDPDAAGSMPVLYGGASSTLRDYGRFLAMISGDGRCGEVQVLSASSLLAMHTNQVGDLPLRFAGPRRMQAQSRYGLGCWLDAVDASGRGLQMSSPGSFGTMPWVNRERRLFGVLLQVNSPKQPGGFIDPFSLVERVHAAVDAAGRPGADG